MSNYRTEALEAFTERFSDVLGSDGMIRDDAETPQYWQDDVAELADTMIPIYTSDLVQAWIDAGYPDVDDSGVIEGVTDVTKIMAAALYETYSGVLCEIADEAGFEW